MWRGGLLAIPPLGRATGRTAVGGHLQGQGRQRSQSARWYRRDMRIHGCRGLGAAVVEADRPLCPRMHRRAARTHRLGCTHGLHRRWRCHTGVGGHGRLLDQHDQHREREQPADELAATQHVQPPGAATTGRSIKPCHVVVSTLGNGGDPAISIRCFLWVGYHCAAYKPFD